MALPVFFVPACLRVSLSAVGLHAVRVASVRAVFHGARAIE